MAEDNKGFSILPRITRNGYLAFDVEYKTLCGYFCKDCKSYNDILTSSCKVCNLSRPSELDKSSTNTAYKRSGLRVESERLTMTDEDKTDLHYKFFNEEVVAVNELDDNELRLRLEELIAIDFEAKARINGIQSVERARRAKKSEKEKAWLVNTDTSVTVSDALNNVKERKKRMSAGDKQYQDLVNILGKEEADKILGGVAKYHSNGAVTTGTNRQILDKSEAKPKPTVGTSNSCKIMKHQNCSGTYDNTMTCDCHCHKPKTQDDFFDSLMK